MKNLFTLFLTAALCVTILPGYALAADDAALPETEPKQEKIVQEGDSAVTGEKEVQAGDSAVAGEEEIRAGVSAGTDGAGEQIDLSDASFSKIKVRTYAARPFKPAVTVMLGGKTLTAGTDYKTSYQKNENVGTGKITIKGKGNYTGTASTTFRIRPQGTSISKVGTPDKKNMCVKLTWKKQDVQTTGYQIQYSADETFAEGSHTKTVADPATTSYTLKKLGKKKYYVRIRTYKTVNGKKNVSAWSKVKTFSFVKAQTVDLEQNITYEKYDMTGDGKKDTLKVRLSGKVSPEGYYTVLDVLVNGKRAYRIRDEFGFYYAKIQYVRLVNGKPFLFLSTITDNDYASHCALYQYQDGKLKRVLNVIGIMDENYGYDANGYVAGATGNTVKICVNNMNYTLGVGTAFQFAYTWNGSKFKRDSATGKVTEAFCGGDEKKFKTNKKINVYSKVDAASAAFQVPKGKNVMVDQCRLAKSGLWLHITYGRKSGWIKAQKGYQDEDARLFSNIMYGG